MALICANTTSMTARIWRSRSVAEDQQYILRRAPGGMHTAPTSRVCRLVRKQYFSADHHELLSASHEVDASGCTSIREASPIDPVGNRYVPIHSPLIARRLRIPFKEESHIRVPSHRVSLYSKAP